MSQFRPVARMGARKEMPRGGQFRATTNHMFVKEAPTPPSRKGKCKAKDDTCNGFATKDSEYCAGHLRSMGLLGVSDEEGRADRSDSGAAGS